MIQGRDFIFTGLQPWDISIGSNAKDIALEVSKNNRVLYINTPLDKKTYLSSEKTPENIHRTNVIKGEQPCIRKINSNLWILDFPFTIAPINFLPDGWLFDIANRINNRKMYVFVKKILEKLQFKECILFIDNDMYRSFYAKEYLRPALSVYYRRDNMVSSFWKKHAPRIEPLICAKSDCVVANSEQLADAVRAYNERAINVGQGVDLSNFNPNLEYTIPDDIKDIPRPIIGYTGMLTSKRLDIQLIYELAKATPTYSYVLVGPEDEVFKNHPLHTLKNIYFTGIKNSSLMPSYIYAFDVCLNPQLINPITIGNYPRKVDEYLALGKPVVATRTKTMSLFAGYTWNCIGKEEYKEAIQAALKSNSEQDQKQRIVFAHTHSWVNSVKCIYDCISQISKDYGIPI